MSDEPLTFLASIAPLDSAIQVSSHGGARVKIDLAESEMPAIVRLMLYRGKVLRMTVAIEDARKPARPRKAKRGTPEAPEWGDDDENESNDTG